MKNTFFKNYSTRLEYIFYPPVALIIMASMYFFTAMIQKQRGIDYWTIIITKLDIHIPYMSIFIIPYSFLCYIYPCIFLWYIYTFKTYDIKKYRSLIMSLMALMMLCSLIWIVFPTSIHIRPPLSSLSHNGFLDKITFFLLYFNGWCVFPSFHCALSFYFLLVSKYFVKPGHRWIFFIITTLIILSVIFTKAHYILDVPSGMLCAFIIYQYCFKKLITI